MPDPLMEEIVAHFQDEERYRRELEQHRQRQRQKLAGEAARLMIREDAYIAELIARNEFQ